MRIVKLVMLAGLCLSQKGFATTNSRVDVTRDKKSLIFKVTPNDGLVINLEGPWKLDVKEHAGLKLEKLTYDRKVLNETLTGFEVPVAAESGVVKGTVTYRLVAFVCTKDKSRCYRDVHESSAHWQDKAP